MGGSTVIIIMYPIYYNNVIPTVILWSVQE